MSEIQKRTFIKGLDSDTADEYLEEGKDRFRLNVRVLSSESGNMGAIETMAGNSLVSFPLPSGTNTVIGSFEDGLQRKNYYFMHNSVGSHGIYEYNQDTQVINTVLRKSFLNFDLDHLITGIDIVRLLEDAHLLYWTDNFNQPRKINIEKGILHTQGNFTDGYKQNITTKEISRIKNPPSFPPTYTWSNFEGGTAAGIVMFGNSRNNISNPLRVGSEILVWANSSGVGNISGGTDFVAPSTETFSVVMRFIGNAKSSQSNISGGFLVLFELEKRLASGGAWGTIEVRATPLSTTSTSTGFFDISLTISGISLNAGDRLRWKSTITSSWAFVELQTVATWQIKNQGSTIIAAPNYLYKKLWTFKYKYIYDDFEESAWSPISRYEFPDTEGDNANSDNMLAHSNRIELYINTGSSIVTRIRIAAKEANEVDFRTVAEIDKEFSGLSDNARVPYSFLNSSASLFIEPNDNIKLFDNVPLLSQSQAFTGKRIMDGLITEGFNQIGIDIKLDLVYNPLLVNALSEHYPARSYLKSGGEYIFGIVYYNTANQSSTTHVTDGSFDETNNKGVFGTHLFLPFLTQAAYAPFLNKPPNTDGAAKRFVYENPNDVQVSIFNKPPEWATHYQVVRTKNLSFQLVFQWVAGIVAYNNADRAIATAVTLHLANIFDVTIATSYISQNPDTTVLYEYVAGDRIRFIGRPLPANANFTNTEVQDPFEDYVELEIRSYEEETWELVVALPITGPGADIRNLLNGSVFEIFRPILAVESGTTNELDQIPTYEMGEAYPILRSTTGLVHTGPARGQALFEFTSMFSNGSNLVALGSGSTGGIAIGDTIKLTITALGSSFPPSPSLVEQFAGIMGTVTSITGGGISFTIDTFIGNGSYNIIGYVARGVEIITRGGDTFIRRQNMHYSAEGTSTTGSQVFYNVEANDVNNMYVSPAPDEGRINLVDPDAREVVRPSSIFWSEQFVPETFINGLSSVFDFNFESFNESYGGIYKLHSEDAGLIMFQERKMGMVLVDRTLYTDLQNNNTVGASANVLSPQVIYYAGEYGIGVHPESFAVYGKSKYGIDVIRGVSWRLSQDGLTPLSDTNSMHNYFTDKCKDVISSTGKVNIHGVYDVKFSEYITAFEPYTNSNNISVAGETLAWNELINQYSTFYSYVPENMVGAGIDIITFKDGALYTHNTNALQSNFYDTQFFAEFWSMLNANPSNVKVLENISEESNGIWEVYEIVTPNGQSSNLIEADFVTKENNQYAAVLRDENTPNIALPLIEGDKMRDRTFLAKFRYNQTGFNKLFAVNFFYIESPRSNK